MTNRPWIIGSDLISPLGSEPETQWQRAAAGESGIGPLTRFPLPADFPVTVAGQVPAIDVTPYDFLSPRKMAHWTSPIFLHAMLVVHRAMQRAGLEIDAALAPRVATTFSTAIGGLDAVLAADRNMVARGRLPHPFTNPNACVNMVAGKVSMLTGATGPITTTITACATGNSSIIAGAMFIEAGMADVAICGAVDFPLVEPIVGGFATMNGAYKTKADSEEDVQRASRPFSVDRRGFVVSEGAACVLLASPNFARAHGLSAAFELAGWGMSADAHHFVAPHLPSVSRCMNDTIKHAGLAPRDVSAINAHAASTKVGDAVEVQALRQVFGEHLPPLSANKSLIGHAMGASSAIETVLALMGMERDTILPTIGYKADPALGELDCVAEGARSLKQEHVLNNSFGFGGCNACLLLRRLA